MMSHAKHGTDGMKLYQYVGPPEIAARIQHGPAGVPVHSAADVRNWMRDTGQERRREGVVATFVVNAAGILLIADRRSEHVACAGGQPVRSAGEMTFSIGREVEVIEASNQSVGYCPEPETWPAVADTLLLAKIAAPADFSPKCTFRRCVKCANVTLVKENDFRCGLCSAGLPLEYNVQVPLEG
jgi:hypothetical protein